MNAAPDARGALARAWSTPATVLGFLGAVNHKQVGLRYILTALGFFLIAGIDATIIRAQLAVPGAELVSPDRFNQLFTTHGSAMMFLFAVPMVEGVALYLLPMMLGARDAPFPRLTAFSYWLYLFGGLLLYSSTLPDIVNFVWPGVPLLPNVVPDAGWFAYPPLSGPEFSPGTRLDFWLMGVTLAEISAIIAAAELIVLVLKVRAPGMTLMRMPLFAWSVLAMAFAILFAFPAVVLASTLLELERAAGMPFYDPTAGGDPILWQHLFWIFGHPEVYIMFIPATGIVSMVLPTFASRPIIGYLLIVPALLATAILSFGLWVHHMFAAGLPWLGLTYFSASSMLITIPSGVQVFAWLATLLKAPRIRLSTAMLFILGFLVTFVLGGVTGVMVASVPFDLQAHDTYFVVAHFHYVLVGGVVLPVFAGIFYWFPKATGRALSERLGRWFFWLFFIGFNLTFLPQHQLGLLGMRRRVYTYESDFWVDLLNLASSAGQAIMIAGIAVFALAVGRALLSRPTADRDPWRGGTLEWALASPPEPYNFASLPGVRSRDPLWDEPDAVERVERLPPALRSRARVERRLPRETLVTGALGTEPQSVAVLPGNTLLPLLAAGAVATVFVAILFRLYPLAAAAGLGALALFAVWGWNGTRESRDPAAGTSLDPRGASVGAATGRRSHVWWGGMVGIAVGATIYLDALFAHLYLVYGTDAEGFRAVEADALLGAGGVLAGVLAAGASLLAPAALRSARATVGRLLPAAAVALGAAQLILLAAGYLLPAPAPNASGYAAAWWLLVGLQLVVVAIGTGLSGYVLLRSLRGHFDAGRHVMVEITAAWWAFAALAGLLAYAALHLAPGFLS